MSSCILNNRLQIHTIIHLLYLVLYTPRFSKEICLRVCFSVCCCIERSKSDLLKVIQWARHRAWGSSWTTAVGGNFGTHFSWAVISSWTFGVDLAFSSEVLQI